MRHHWHVMYSTIGCLPDSNGMYSNKRYAMVAAAQMAREEREAGNEVTGRRESGYDVGQYNRIQVSRCYDDCESED